MADEHNDEEREHGLSTARIETLADGVFAIAMTLLVLEIQPPQNINDILGAQYVWRLFAYLLSFLALGVFWVGHHNQYFYIRHADRTFLWINILFLAFVAFIPFSASLLGTALIAKSVAGGATTYIGYSDSKIPYLVYGVNLTLCTLALYLHWRYGMNNRGLTHGEVEPRLVRLGTRMILRGPLLYLIATAAAFASTELSTVFFVLVSLTYILPNNLDDYWSRWRRRGRKQVGMNSSASKFHGQDGSSTKTE